MKNPAAIFGIVLESAFIVYCIYMTYLADIHDPISKDWLIPNMLIGGAVLGVGLFIAMRLTRSVPGNHDDHLRGPQRLR